MNQKSVLSNGLRVVTEELPHFHSAAVGIWLAVSFEPLVSTDYNGVGFSAVVDAELTNVMGGTLVKVMAWYDNEMGFSNRMLDLAAYVGRHAG